MEYQSIYDRLRAAGLTEAGALAVLGNFDCESNCISYRLQGDFTSGYPESCQYTADVDSGRISKQQFQNDQKGYGLAQWTYWSRKAALYDFWKYRGGSIGDETMQVEFTLLELRSDYSGLMNYLCTSTDLYECTKQFCYKFENPAFKNVDARYNAAVRIKNEINLNPQPVPPDPPVPPTPPDPPLEIFWPPRTIDCHCEDWPEVSVLGSVLYCRGYLTYAKMTFDDEMTQAVIDFQRDYSLDADGCVGPKTWKALLEM